MEIEGVKEIINYRLKDNEVQRVEEGLYATATYQLAKDLR